MVGVRPHRVKSNANPQDEIRLHINRRLNSFTARNLCGENPHKRRFISPCAESGILAVQAASGGNFTHGNAHVVEERIGSAIALRTVFCSNVIMKDLTLFFFVK